MAYKMKMIITFSIVLKLEKNRDCFRKMFYYTFI